ncbi:unnamed protein product [Owenia fusiformis]|uniref:Uncharacterized protein n=1 Tax=Owenia fusiformis TaxID=6347 RepID=A0A8J1TZC2_OWEFU|nr:unnamed protein product [Owenia fusiformis]
MKAKLDTFINEILQCRGKIGMNLAIVQDNEPLYTTGYGYADLENQVPDDGETIHFIYSVSKSFVVTLFAQLIEETGISWNSLVKDLLPKFRFRDEERNKGLQLRDLLGQASGLPEKPLSVPFNSVEEFVNVLKCTEPVMGMRQSFCYVDVNYFLAGAILEHLTNKSFSQLMHERIFTPLKMNSTFPSLAHRYNESLGKFAYGYRLVNGEVVVIDSPGTEGEVTETLWAAAMGVMTTAEDMAEYMKFHLGAYRNDGSLNPIVDPNILREMYKPNQVINFYTSFLEIDGLDDIDETWRVYAYGMGFWMGNFRESDFIQHGGYGTHDTIMTLFKQWNLGIYTSLTGPRGVDSHATMSFIHFYIADILRGNTPIFNISYACNYTLPAKEGGYCGRFEIHPDTSIDKTKSISSPVETYTGSYVNLDDEAKIKVDPNRATLVMTKGCEEYHLYPSGVPHAFVAESTGECYGCAKRVVFTILSETGLVDDFSSLRIDDVEFQNSRIKPEERKCDVSLASDTNFSRLCLYSMMAFALTATTIF